MNIFKQFIKSSFGKGLSIYYALIITLSFLLLGVYKHQVIYFLPLSINYLLVMIGILLLAIIIIKHNGEFDIKDSLINNFILFLLPLILVLVGVWHPLSKNMEAYIPSKISTVLSTKTRNQLFTNRSISDLKIKIIESKETNYPIDETRKSKVLIFHRKGCEFCGIALPEILEHLSENQKNNISFIDLDDKNSRSLAIHYDIEGAASVVYFKKNTNGAYTKHVDRLVKYNNQNNIGIDKKVMKNIEKMTK